MVFADWTFSGESTGTLDGVTKYAGSSSYKSYIICPDHTSKNSYIQHNTFLEPQARIVMQCRYHRSSTSYVVCGIYVLHSSYGSVKCVMSAFDAWEKHRVTFWYDVTANTKFGRDEKWNGSAWEATSGDTNFGSGSPAVGSISLRGYGASTANIYRYLTHWFDEVEVYS